MPAHTAQLPEHLSMSATLFSASLNYAVAVSHWHVAMSKHRDLLLKFCIRQLVPPANFELGARTRAHTVTQRAFRLLSPSLLCFQINGLTICGTLRAHHHNSIPRHNALTTRISIWSCAAVDVFENVWLANAAHA